jgi:hypothetical protein
MNADERIESIHGRIEFEQPPQRDVGAHGVGLIFEQNACELGDGSAAVNDRPTVRKPLAAVEVIQTFPRNPATQSRRQLTEFFACVSLRLGGFA